MACVANVVNFVGIALLILGAYLMYFLDVTIGGPFATPGLIGGFGVFLFGVCCLITGLSVLGKMKGAWGIMAIVAINFIIALYLLIA
jgi:hypothetical protein